MSNLASEHDLWLQHELDAQIEASLPALQALEPAQKPAGVTAAGAVAAVSTTVGLLGGLFGVAGAVAPGIFAARSAQTGVELVARCGLGAKTFGSLAKMAAALATPKHVLGGGRLPRQLESIRGTRNRLAHGAEEYAVQDHSRLTTSMLGQPRVELFLRRQVGPDGSAFVGTMVERARALGLWPPEK